MAATVTLSTTTLNLPVLASDGRISVVSTAGLVAGTRLWIDKEMLSVVSLGVNPWVNVRRGVDGTAASDHDSGVIVTIGRADQFYSVDPSGRPPEAIPVSPYINVLNGSVWFAQGDALPSGLSNRWWQNQTTTYATGALGIRTTTQDPTSST